ncbi:MAG: redoxin domain-containing protein, partial [Pseudomonadota bacterium]
MNKAIAEGSNAPQFTLPINGGGETSLVDYAGRWLVLYFYPKDDTSGCTK